MLLAIIQNAVNDSLKAADTTSLVLHKITFNLDAVGKGNGLSITFAGLIVVFSALTFLFLILSNLSRVINHNWENTFKKKNAPEESKKEKAVSGEINAAIGLALHLYFQEQHDEQNTILTIQKNAKPYTPWSSKIYGLRRWPR
jgi:Na+-transporting methylmalonyl-CoA/oxaloacetate decarboxylase gamma subunit